MKILRNIVGVILGYLVMILLITLVQEIWFGGVGWDKSSILVLLVAGLFTFLSAVVAGFTASLIAGNKSKFPVIIMSFLVAIETFALLVTGRIGGPLWFDLSGSASLIVGVVIGWAIVVWFTKPTNFSTLTVEEG